ncbi:hypothetical protein BU23DRAFT_231231 [Bimuria novae-zelandiae CBS 107.79]|uniref:Uncharacterized protein n=1 Tax=Bimuria novae-zelandiae CBS 107.79 TaxID=1447943 RepID=A0A6A5UZ01_9PLEO|nr:hypothetical protein BU23DRAFT_231231 [Bimuria novae-zelandiae CBS 107.79]
MTALLESSPHEYIRQAQREKMSEQQQAKIRVNCLKGSWRAEIEGRPLVLSGNGDIVIDTGDNGSHLVAPYFLPYPGTFLEGLATTTTADAAPIQEWVLTLNWLYLDTQTHQLKYGVKTDAEAHLSGPFDCTTQNHHLIFQAWEGFCVV